MATAVVVGSLVLGACRTDRELTTPKPIPVDEENLAATLLTASDLPPGFTQKEGAGTPITTELIPEHDCDDAITELKPALSFSRDFSGQGRLLTDTAAWFPGQGGAAEQVFRNIQTACRQVAVPADGLSLRTLSLNFGALSDNTLAMRVEAEPTTGPIEERDLIVMRQGDLLHIVRLVGPRPSDKVLLDAAVRATIGRLGLLHLDTT
ncbi:MAG: hypothetical protein WD691_08030 [Acidimicrobiales bacterium]